MLRAFGIASDGAVVNQAGPARIAVSPERRQHAAAVSLGRGAGHEDQGCCAVGDGGGVGGGDGAVVSLEGRLAALAGRGLVCGSSSMLTVTSVRPCLTVTGTTSSNNGLRSTAARARRYDSSEWRS